MKGMQRLHKSCMHLDKCLLMLLMVCFGVVSCTNNSPTPTIELTPELTSTDAIALSPANASLPTATITPHTPVPLVSHTPTLLPPTIRPSPTIIPTGTPSFGEATAEDFRLRPPSPEALQNLLLQALPVYWYDRTGVPNYLRPNDALDLIHFLDRYFVLYDDNAFTRARNVLEEISSGRKEDWLPLTAEGLRRVLQLGVVQTLNETEHPLGDEFEGRFRYNILLPFDMNRQPTWLVEVFYRHLNGRDSFLLTQTTTGVYERWSSELVYVGSPYVNEIFSAQVIDEYDLTGDSAPELILLYISDPNTIERIDVYQWDEETLRYLLTVENAPDHPYEFTIDDIDGDGLVDIQKLRRFSTIESCLINESFVYSWDGLQMRKQRTLVASPNSVECYNLIPTPTAIPTSTPAIIASAPPYDPDKPWSEQIEFEGFRLPLYSAVRRLEERLQPGTDFEQLRELIQHVIGQIPTDTQVRDVVISRLLFMFANSYELEGNEPMAVAQYLALVQQYPESLWSQLAQARLEPVDG